MDQVSARWNEHKAGTRHDMCVREQRGGESKSQGDVCGGNPAALYCETMNKQLPGKKIKLTRYKRKEKKFRREERRKLKRERKRVQLT